MMRGAMNLLWLRDDKDDERTGCSGERRSDEGRGREARHSFLNRFRVKPDKQRRPQLSKKTREMSGRWREGRPGRCRRTARSFPTM